jgi:hypothetical protein
MHRLVARTRVGHYLLQTSRLTFALSFLLAMMTPGWQEGVFTYLPILRFRLSGQRFQIGILALLPGVAATTWVLARFFERPARPWRWGPAHVALPLLLFCAVALIRIWPIHIRHRAAVTLVSVLVYLGTYLYVLQNWPEQWCVGLVAVLLLLQGGIAVTQFLKQGSVGLSWMGEGMLDPDGQGVSVIEAAGRRWLRAYGLTPHPNVLGGYLSTCMLVCLGTLRTVRPIARRLLWGAIALGGLGLFFTFSRAAWLGMVIGLFYLVWTMRPWRMTDKRILVLVVVLLIVLSVALGVLFRDLLISRFVRLGSPLESTSIRERLEDYRQAWGLIRAVPFKGVGSGYYIDALWAGVGEDRPPGFRKVHNTYLLAAAELGVGGALLWLGTLLAPPVVLARQALKIGVVRGAGWAAACLCAAVLCLFDSYLYVPSILWPALYLGLFAGAWARVAGAGVDRSNQVG